MKVKLIYDFVLELEKQNIEVNQKLGQLKQMVGEVLEENTRLKIENEALVQQFEKQEDVEQDESGDTEFGEKNVRKRFDIRSNGSLEKLYSEGFHICNDSFGKLRVSDECIFCSPLLKKR